VRLAGVRIRPRLFAIAGGVLLLAILLVYSVDLLRAPPPTLDAAALDRISDRNRNAAMISAARLRAESAASTNAAEDLREAQARGGAAADEMMARSEAYGNASDNAARPAN
jgi:hypothetical protein